MMIYIWKQSPGYFVECDEPIDAEYWEGLIGSTYKDFLDGKWIRLSEELIAFHIANPNATIDLVLAMSIPERTLEDAKNEKLNALLRRDSSRSVNSFIVKSEGEEDIIDWLTPKQRADYRSSIDAAELLNVETLSLYVGEKEITLPTGTAKIMLAKILLYANQCFMVTKQHEASIKALETIEAVDSYDITTGYPEKIVFNL